MSTIHMQQTATPEKRVGCFGWDYRLARKARSELAMRFVHTFREMSDA